MALLRSKFSEVPSDAVVLTESEAARYQAKILSNWKHTPDVYGSYVLGGASFLTGIFLNNHLRHKFRLFHYGRAASYLPVCVIPATFSTILHVEVVLRDVLLQKTEKCPVCLEMRASAIQTIIGCVFPTVLGTISTLSLSQKYMTYDIPYITKQPMKVWNLIRNSFKPIANSLFYIFIAQAVLGSVVTYLEAKSVTTVNTKLAKLEYELEHS